MTTEQKRALHMIGASESTDDYARFNILLSTGEKSKVADWQN